MSATLHFLAGDGEGEASAAGDGRPSDTDALDAYSRVVTAVARDLAPSVANLRGSRRLRGGAVGFCGRGAGVLSGGGRPLLIPPDGYPLPSAHVVEGSRRGSASFVDGREMPFAVVG